jgi:hypothetical protein
LELVALAVVAVATTAFLVPSLQQVGDTEPLYLMEQVRLAVLVVVVLELMELGVQAQLIRVVLVVRVPLQVLAVMLLAVVVLELPQKTLVAATQQAEMEYKLL